MCHGIVFNDDVIRIRMNWNVKMYAEMASSTFNVFIMVCVYAITNAIIDISKSLCSINHYLFVSNRDHRIFQQKSQELSKQNTSL